MFYCESCRNRNDWPEAFGRSRGKCELCGQVRTCYDRPSSSLPFPPTDTERREAMRQDVLKMAERADDAIEFHLSFQVTFVPRDQWSTGHYEERRDEFRDHASRCRAFAEELGR